MGLIEVTELDPAAGTERNEVRAAFEAGQEASLLGEWSSFDRHLLARSGTEVTGWAAIRDAPQRFTADICAAPGAQAEAAISSLVDEVVSLAGNNRIIEWWSRGETSVRAASVARSKGVELSRSVLRLEMEMDQPRPDLETIPFDFDLADELVRANNATFAGHPDRGQLSVAALSDELARVGPTSDLLLDLTSDGRRVRSFVWVKRCDLPEGEIYVLGVTPEYQGQGFGKRILEVGLAHLKQAFEARKAVLYVDREHTAARRLYEARGFWESGAALDCYVLQT